VVYPHLIQWIVQRTIMHTQHIDKVWRADMQRLIKTLTPEQKSHYDTIDPTIRQAWTDGRLNPGSFVLGVIYPDYFSSLVDLKGPFTQMQIGNMAQHFTRIRQVAQANHAEVLVVSVPWGIYMSAKDQQHFARLGFQIDPRMVTNDVQDDSIAQACRLADLPFLSVTWSMRQACATQSLFYPLDCHFNAEGNRIFAEQMAPLLLSRLKAAGR
jgi:hypothetical protein